ncbi:MAG TPA: hypothetical protein VI814_07240 [Candidatus Limnocylindria bacterium]
MVDPLTALVRSPRTGVPLVLARGNGFVGLFLVGVTTALSTTVAYRTLTETSVNDFFFGPTRHPFVIFMLDALGRDRTSVIVYLVQRSFEAVVTATALSPFFVWLLGSTAVHASARLAGVTRPFAPLFVLFAYATALALVPADAATLALGDLPDLANVASLIGLVCLAWLGLITYRAIEVHYEVAGARAFRILLVAVVLFYLVPLALIVLAALGIVLAAIVLGYV